jgi:tetratricopeptide (TPR) repeat protein
MTRPTSVLPAALLGAAILAVAGCEAVRLLGASMCPPVVARAAASPADASLSAALARCERLLGEAWNQRSNQPNDGPSCLRVASLEMRRGGLLALAAYEEECRQQVAFPDDASALLPRWRSRFLHADPGSALTRATEAARAALRARLDAPARRQALLLLAGARAGLGNYAGEAAALAEAARREPEQAWLWLRLSEAYGRARRFAQAEAARGRGLAVLAVER